jgi:hypothetical protein
VAIRHCKSLEESHRERRPNSEFYLRSTEEIGDLFKECPEAFTYTLKIAERCDAIVAVGGKSWHAVKGRAGIPFEVRFAMERGLPCFLIGGLQPRCSFFRLILTIQN